MFIFKNNIDENNVKGMIYMDTPMIYDLRKPKHVDPDKTYPALFLIHGMGSNEQNMFPLVQGLEEDFYIFSIRGPISQPPGFAFFTIEGYGKPHREVRYAHLKGMASRSLALRSPPMAARSFRAAPIA